MKGGRSTTRPMAMEAAVPLELWTQIVNAAQDFGDWRIKLLIDQAVIVTVVKPRDRV